jgi:hypothetical protein
MLANFSPLETACLPSCFGVSHFALRDVIGLSPSVQVALASKGLYSSFENEHNNRVSTLLLEGHGNA